MRPENVYVRTTAVALFLLATAGIYSQEQRPRQLDRAQLIAAAREIMGTAHNCALITMDGGGRMRARAMDPFLPDDRMIVWLATNPKSLKVREIRRHPKVTLYYFERDEQAYVSLSGTARLVNDPKEKDRRWKDEWKAFYPNRRRDYLLIAVEPERLEVVNVKKGIVGDPITWTPPTVEFRTSKSK